jgi:hypothetical protein
MTPKELENIAHELITNKVNKGEVVHMHYTVQELICDQGMINGEAAPFYTLCAKEHVYRVVKKVVDRYDDYSESVDNQQLNLDGFDHLRKAYTVKREKERVLVPIELMTDIEILHRADEFDALADGLKTHARELRQFVADRSPLGIAA